MPLDLKKSMMTPMLRDVERHQEMRPRCVNRSSNKHCGEAIRESALH